MIKKLFSKYFLEVIPSIVATVVGAYIVTHYINARSDADKPKAAVSAPADTSKDAPQTLKADEAGDRPAAAVKAEAARLKAEKLAAEKAAAERAAADRAENARKAAEKLASEKAEKAAAAEKVAAEKAAAEKRERERATAKAAPVAPQPAAEANATPERDANDLARAAIERLRKSSPQPVEQSRTQEAARTEEARPQPERAKVNSVVYAPAAPQPPIQPLPPAVNVAPAPPELAVATPPAPFPRPVDSSGADDDASRLTPPADIPARQSERSHDRNRSVAEGVVSAARSVFHAVIPERSN
ncbi:MAG: cell envelope biogenesis protein TolA [Afipia sp.]|nr:cell envelope biogenesis protein TolA [Afipia sp.]